MKDLQERQIKDIAEKDELTKDLVLILDENGISQAKKEVILLQLLPYIIRRDHKIFNHAYHVGRESA